MATSTVENYVKRLYEQQQHCGEELVPLGRLALAMEVVPGTATTMVKALAEAGLVRYEPRQGARLTPAGEKLALHVVRRHRLIELFLVKVLNFDWTDVHEEAEEMEHAISDRLMQRIDEYLGHPVYDPHGDPIPTAAGKVKERRTRRLSKCAAGERVGIARITDQDARFLRYATDRGLVPGARAVVEASDPVGESIRIKVSDGEPLTLGAAAAARILVVTIEANAGDAR